MAQLLLLFSPLPCIPLTWWSNAHGCAISLSQRSSSIINFNFINHHQFPKARVQTCKFCYSHPQMRPHWERSEQCTNDFVPKISTLLKSMAHNFAWKASTRSNDLCYMGEHIQCYRLLGCYHVTVWNNSCYSHQKIATKICGPQILHDGGRWHGLSFLLHFLVTVAAVISNSNMITP